MITTIDTAELAGTSRCIGVSNLRRGFKLPRWQFEPTIWLALKSLDPSDGRQLLAFL